MAKYSKEQRRCAVELYVVFRQVGVSCLVMYFFRV